MPNSLDKSKIKILLLEGVHPTAAANFRADGYSNVELHSVSLSGRNCGTRRATRTSSGYAPPRIWTRRSSNTRSG